MDDLLVAKSAFKYFVNSIYIDERDKILEIPLSIMHFTPTPTATTTLASPFDNSKDVIFLLVQFCIEYCLQVTSCDLSEILVYLRV